MQLKLKSYVQDMKKVWKVGEGVIDSLFQTFLKKSRFLDKIPNPVQTLSNRNLRIQVIFPFFFLKPFLSAVHMQNVKNDRWTFGKNVLFTHRKACVKVWIFIGKVKRKSRDKESFFLVFSFSPKSFYIYNKYITMICT